MEVSVDSATAENVTYTYDDVTVPNKGKGRLTRIASQGVILDRVYPLAIGRALRETVNRQRKARARPDRSAFSHATDSRRAGSSATIGATRGNIVTDTRTIAGLVHTTSYLYDAADRVTQITYPSGRIVNYVRDTTGRITSATTKQNAAAAVVTLASGIVRQPQSNIVQTRARDRRSPTRRRESPAPSKIRLNRSALVCRADSRRAGRSATIGAVYGNGLNDWNTFTNDYEQDLLQVYNGATPIINRRLVSRSRMTVPLRLAHSVIRDREDTSKVSAAVWLCFAIAEMGAR